MTYQALDWDSDYFGFPIGRVSPASPADLEPAVAAADADRVRCLYLLCPADDDETLHAAIGLGFRPYDVRIELGRALEAAPAAAPDVRAARLDDVPELERIVRERLVGTRFWVDPGFPHDRVAELYVQWLRRGLETPTERRTLVAGAAEGVVICRLDVAAGLGTIELVAVAGAAEGRGVGSRLLAAADAVFADAGLTRVEVVTQARNVGAQRLYQRHGYRTERVGWWLHRWSAASP